MPNTPAAAPAVSSTVGLKNMVIAPVTADTETATTYGDLQRVAGAIEATITPENNDPDIQYFDDVEGDVLYPDPELTFKTKLADLPLIVQEMIFSNKIDDNGVLIRTAALKTLSNQEGYKTFVVPDNVGGRYSVLTPVGLLPIAVAGFDIRAMLAGAAEEREALMVKSADNAAVQYAAMRNLLHLENGKSTEILVTYNPKLTFLAEWWKQLYGESEGKDLKGIFPASVANTADLHSMGQFIQEGSRIMFETVVSVEKSNRSVVIGSDEQNLYQLNYLAGQHVNHCNAMAQLGTKLAHIDGGVPQMEVSIESINEKNLGAIFYFFEFACGVSAYVLGVNPFNQPGVEAYKKNMFALLEKPGYEEQTKAIKARI